MDPSAGDGAGPGTTEEARATVGSAGASSALTSAGEGAGGEAEARAGGRREVRPVGDVGVLVGCTGPEDALRVATVLRRAGERGGVLAPSGVVDVVPAERTVLVTAAVGELTPDRVGRVLRELLGEPVTGVESVGVGSPAAEVAAGHEGREAAAAGARWRPEAPTLRCPVHFDGPDLAATAQLLGRSPNDLVSRVVGAVWRVAFCGFSPGFGYCVGGGLDVPRLARPRTAVPARSVGLAGPYAGVYPRESPGGWRLVGRLADDVPELFDPDRDPPALLVPGARVRFEAC